MLQATVMGDHQHAQSIRPDRIIRTGVIEPYPVQEWNPTDIARRILEPFATLMPSTVGPQVSSDPSPEEVVEQARNYARAVDQGISLPPWLSQAALSAIAAIRKGVPFVVKAQGRALLVKPSPLDQTTINGPGGTSLPGAPIMTIQNEAASRMGPDSTLLRIAGAPGRRQAADRQVQYLLVR